MQPVNGHVLCSVAIYCILPTLSLAFVPTASQRESFAN